MNNNCNCVIRAESIALKNGKYTITVSDGELTGLCTCKCVQVGLYTTLPVDTECNLVEITDGTNTLQVSIIEKCCDGGCIADLWRTTLHCRTILVMRYAPVSNSLTLIDVKGKRKCGA